MSEIFTVKGSLTLDSDGFHEGVDEAIQEGKKLADTVDEQSKGVKGSLTDAFSVMGGNLMSKAFSAALGFLVDVGKEAIQTASDIQEVQNVVDVTFGDNAAAIESWANTAQSQFGLTELQAKQYTSTLGAMLKSMGIGESDVYGMSTAMAGLAADMASFYNLDFDEAFNKIRSGISGETEPLKQLGINMSVANLEAYALSQGITKAYESMSQAEQAALRYNYLMSVTADAQGDFARTSDGLANSWRQFKTSMSSIVASIGEAVLPVVNDAINMIGDMIDSFGSLPKSLSKIDKSYNDNVAAIELNQLHAEALIDTLDALSKKEELTAVESAQWKSAVQQLTAIYPELQSMIGSTTGELNTSIEAIKAETEALKESAMEKALIAALEAKKSTYYDYIGKTADAQLELNKAQAEYDAAVGKRTANEEKRAEIWASLRTEAEKFGLTLPEIYSGVEGLDGEFDFFKLYNEGKLPEDFVVSYREGRAAIQELNAEYTELVKNENAEHEQLKDAENRHKELNDQLTAEAENVAAWDAAAREAHENLAELTGTSENAADGMNGLNNAGGNTVNVFSETSLKADDLKKKLEKLQTAGKQAQQLFDEIEQYKLNTFSNIAKSVEGLYGTFAKADKVRKTSYKSMMQGVESQIEQSQRWLAARKQMQEMGASEELLANFDYSPEGIAQMEALIKAGPEALAEMKAQLDEAAALRGEVTNELYTNALEADSEYQAMVSQAEAIASAVAQGMAELQTAVDALELNIEAEDGASSVIKDVKEGLEKLNGQKAITFVETIPLRPSATGSFAKGLDRVPYDDYVARLHKDEAVLTKHEANEWRNGRGGNGGQVVNVTQNIQAVPMTPSELAAQTKHALGMMRFSV